jgi:hypothetical protein
LSNFFLKRFNALSIDSFSLMLIMIISVHLLSGSKCTANLFNSKAKLKNWSTASGPPQIAICQQLTDHSPQLNVPGTKYQVRSMDSNPIHITQWLWALDRWQSL